MIIKIEGRCAWVGCDKPATHVAAGRAADDLLSRSALGERHPAPACYCEEHAEEVADEGYPEYRTECPNCECKFGVN